MPYQREWDLARNIARRAGEVALSFYHRGTETEEKPDFSPVTVADRESEQLICRLLTESFPEDGILGEEHVAHPALGDLLQQPVGPELLAREVVGRVSGP